MKCKPRFVIMIIACIAVMLVLGSCQAGGGNGTTDSSTVGAGSSDTVEGNSTVDITTVEETSSPEGITTDAGTQAGTEAVTEAVTDNGTGAVITTGTNPVTSAETVPVTVPVTEQATEAVTVPVTEPVTQPVTEATTEVVTSPVTEVTTEAATQPAETTQAETTSAETTSAETTSAETQPVETTSAETTSPETQPEETVHVCVYTKELVAATCTKGGYTLNSCQCGNSYKDNITAAKGHKVNKWTESSAVLESALRCLYKVTYEGSCVNCKEIQTKSASEERHGWCVTVTSSATCVSAGVKGTFCTHKGCEYNTKAYSESEYNDSLAHEWVCEVSSGANLIYSCNYCAKKKTVIDCSEKTAAEIIKDAVLGTDEIVLREAAMSLSEELRAALPSSATLGAEKLTAEEISAATAAMSPADRAILGDAPVYSFSLTAAGENVDFAGGSVTIRLPYVLKTGENPDNVVVWYLADNGSVSAVDAVYSNGYVIFTLSHFSCYAVLELSGEEYCAEYGHAELNVTPASCTEGGRSVCPRCGAVVESAEALGHTWVSQVISELSETTNGVTRFTCSVCGEFYDNITVCEGHVHVLTLVPAAAAGCTKEGNIAYYVCSCGILFSDADGQTEIDNLSLTVVPANGHSPEEIEALASTCVVKGHTAGAKCSVCGELLFGNEETDFAEHKYVGTVTSAGCVSDGYTTFVCSVCNDTYIDNIVGSSGHAYVDTVTPASCTTDGYTTHVCANCGDNYVDGFVGSSGHAYVDTVTPASCTTDGYTTHVCANCGDNYVDGFVGSSGHALAERIDAEASCTSSGISVTYCTKCLQDISSSAIAMTAHVPGEAVTENVVLSTCTSSGHHDEAVYCTVCGSEVSRETVADELLPHKYENGICTECGGCSHEIITSASVLYFDGEYNVCTGVGMIIKRCACGEKAYRVFESTDWGKLCGGCMFQIVKNETSRDAYCYIAQCAQCGLRYEVSGTYENTGHCNYVPHLTTTVSLGNEVLLVADSDTTPVNGCEYESGFQTFPGWDEEYYTTVCKNCGRIADAYENFVEINVSLNHGEEFESNRHSRIEESTYTDELGRVHTVNDKFDGKNKFSLVEDEYAVYSCDCTKTVYGTITIQKEGSVYIHVLTYERTEHDDSFISFVSHSGNQGRCEEGYNGYLVCSCCNKISLESGIGHKFETVNLVTALCDWTLKYHSLSYSHCVICGRNYDLVLENTNKLSAQYSEDGYIYRTCTLCNNFKISELYLGVTQEGCLKTESKLYGVYAPGKSVKSVEISSVTSGHVFASNYYGPPDHITYEMLGSSCIEGVLRTRTCVNCGTVFTDILYEHSYETVTVDTSSSHGSIGCEEGYVMYDRCTFCGHCRNLNLEHIGKHKFGLYKDTVDGYYSVECLYCDLAIQRKSEYEIEYCVRTDTNYTRLVRFDTVLLDFVEEPQTVERHNSVSYYVRTTSSCIDATGYYCIYCQDCGFARRYANIEGHNYDWDEIYKINQNDGFEFYVYQYWCRFCDYTYTTIWDSTSYSSQEVLDDGTVKYTVNNQPNKFKIISSSIVRNPDCLCCGTDFVTYTEVNSSGEIVYEYSQTLIHQPEYRHDYVTTTTKYGHDCSERYEEKKVCSFCGDTQITVTETQMEHDEIDDGYILKGASCEDGWILKTHCAVCGEEWIWEEDNYHLFEEDYNEQHEYDGGCWLTLCGTKCMLCGKKSETDADYQAWCISGEGHYVSGGDYVVRCDNCGLEYREHLEKTAKDGSCWYVQTMITTVSRNGEVLYRKAGESELHTMHNWISPITEHAYDGKYYTVKCADCGAEIELKDTEHFIVWDWYIQDVEGMSVPLYVERSTCLLCGKVFIEYAEACCDMSFVGEEDGWEIYEPDDGSFTYYYKYEETEIDDRSYRLVEAFVYKKEDEILFEVYRDEIVYYSW